MGERRVEIEVSSRRIAAVVLVVAVSIGELNGTGSPGATGSGVKCYMVAAGRMVDGLARVGAEVSSVSSPRNANAGTLDGPCCILQSLLSPISTHNLRTCTSVS